MHDDGLVSTASRICNVKKKRCHASYLHVRGRNLQSTWWIKHSNPYVQIGSTTFRGSRNQRLYDGVEHRCSVKQTYSLHMRALSNIGNALCGASGAGRGSESSPRAAGTGSHSTLRHLLGARPRAEGQERRTDARHRTPRAAIWNAFRNGAYCRCCIFISCVASAVH